MVTRKTSHLPGLGPLRIPFSPARWERRGVRVPPGAFQPLLSAQCPLLSSPPRDSVKCPVRHTTSGVSLSLYT